MTYIYLILIIICIASGNNFTCTINTKDLKESNCVLYKKETNQFILSSQSTIIHLNDGYYSFSFDGLLSNQKVNIKLTGKGDILFNLYNLNNTNIYFDSYENQIITLLYFNGLIHLFSEKTIKGVIIYQEDLSNLKFSPTIIISSLLSFEEINSMKFKKEQYNIEPSFSIKQQIVNTITKIKLLFIEMKQNILYWNEQRKIEEDKLFHSEELEFIKQRVKSKINFLASFINSITIEQIKVKTLCQSCIFWFRLKASVTNALGITTATNFCDYDYVPKTLCKVTVQTTHSLTSKYLYDEKKEEEMYCSSYCLIQKK
ncbi:hypothetical protein ENUP19_0278G0021 [Entamoeba nuttalli]|uniref:Transmembrane protein n=2 Tax=Entamoeba nuttalli TaxID=412467 RepID=K2G909_ENTNP|nr:hypothetical protein ENU1_147570 [Entamoeba nuttalli P19]EKE38936.1 hypothetical protein ENU1_147570 [Entamoeba nuttalli P19]|eukprot:XP_008858733.1 hypothetical protein ENU1_147570 [Entamoeba nuttalli P19]